MYTDFQQNSTNNEYEEVEKMFFGISKDDFDKYFGQDAKDNSISSSVNDKLKHTIELIYINLNTKYPDKKFSSYFCVQGYKTYFLSSSISI